MCGIYPNVEEANCSQSDDSDDWRQQASNNSNFSLLVHSRRFHHFVTYSCSTHIEPTPQATRSFTDEFQFYRMTAVSFYEKPGNPVCFVGRHYS